ncbi:NTP transferase domain-containing protein [Nordella sp. HKS 07]|uniref:nucleotidyltransferase family protein n=1 Tax=Nordella sp. HKS 07 TaxID=2712222 RepID=UPI0013E16990|nr:nucleotidyltransferase family protein [Nordella sp. HKS 07]QIG46531.1 NTP transferase domain-containing protein [Nordella sp. HKS 07]
MTAAAWNVVVLAAGRGPDDPMAKAYRVTHKCLVEVGGEKMLARVVRTLDAHPAVKSIGVVIETRELLVEALGPLAGKVSFLSPQESAARSALAAVKGDPQFPWLITTGDHPLLTTDMLDYFFTEAAGYDADLSAGLASAETILARFPEAKRTFLKFGRDRVSGCNLFALTSDRALAALAFWHDLEKNRKKPWRLIGAFGPVALLRFATGMLTLESAFALASRRLRLTARPVLMPFAEAAVDVDKPEDKELAEKILAERRALPA